uniref:RING-type E3 ubiquitin transferase n=1 Tax=Anopheles quadriannulatus TaxID=34691 RepID=A0A182WW96_ANOQN
MMSKLYDPPRGAPYEISSANPDPDSSSAEENAAASAPLALGRVYATSLPTHIWSINGIKCPVCSKFVTPDDIECHLVICIDKWFEVNRSCPEHPGD